MNWAVFSMVFTIAFTMTIGIIMTAAMVMGYDDITAMLIVCFVGAVLSLPITWIVAKKLQSVGITK